MNTSVLKTLVVMYNYRPKFTVKDVRCLKIAARPKASFKTNCHLWLKTGVTFLTRVTGNKGFFHCLFGTCSARKFYIHPSLNRNTCHTTSSASHVFSTISYEDVTYEVWYSKEFFISNTCLINGCTVPHILFSVHPRCTFVQCRTCIFGDFRIGKFHKVIIGNSADVSASCYLTLYYFTRFY